MKSERTKAAEPIAMAYGIEDFALKVCELLNIDPRQRLCVNIEYDRS